MREDGSSLPNRTPMQMEAKHQRTLRRRRRVKLIPMIEEGSMNNSVKPQNDPMASYASGSDVYGDGSLRLESRRFTYEELKMITNNFQRVLGRGGFGYVYDGFLEDGTQVAVKLRSQSSNQGVKEFLAEAHILTRIHHKNLVSMIGYCNDGEYMALVYEYMSEGTLQDHIEGRKNIEGCLPWRRRLRIALESAQGAPFNILKYLHKGCNPPLIHRDVKATNILLNTKLEARIANFGLSKAFNSESDTYVSTNTLVGMPGYVDPEYQATMQPTAKSDVYSFGVVLLELITGKPAIPREAEPTSIIQWARKRMALGNIESVVDARMRGIYDVNSVWKVADIALKCTSYALTQRPTMTDVVAQLQECIELEEGHASGDVNVELHTTGSGGNPNLSYGSYGGDQSADISQSSTAFDMEENAKRVLAMSMGPVAR
ncbi:probable LRR receptor-like serine/threonine-protein kinase At1g51880 [Triticum urartu]|uniref:probable LRR receptor-like serine/threonine-protein kinase At1g51880 n=1 Tax=Triticum urartu TaxID=4572 RepID=UPI00204460DF|nr:probable LRR receptor-like serine/threonine-protein kinase At1g51880 [Triticum urartu]